MERRELAHYILSNPSWRDGINFLCDLLECTRYDAAQLIARSMQEGYLLA